MKVAHIVYAVVSLVVIAVLVAWFFMLSPFMPTFGTTGGSRTVQIDGNTISVSIADSDVSRQLGLGGRAGLGPEEGMLFIFPTDGMYAFWMKDMQFSIDMIWISSDDKIVYMAQDVAPDTYPHSYISPTPARYVLELPAKYASQHGINVGDSVQL